MHIISMIQEGAWFSLIAQAAPQTPSITLPLVVIAGAVAWAGIWIQLLVIPFLGKGEKLHQDYFASGKLNAAIAAIEANRLIPAVASMFNRALDAQPDRRRRVDMEALLQAVAFLPDLQAAHEATTCIENLNKAYNGL